MLSDADKRRQYDAGGMFGGGPGGGFRFDPSVVPQRHGLVRGHHLRPVRPRRRRRRRGPRRRPGSGDRGPALVRTGDERHGRVGQRPDRGAVPDVPRQRREARHVARDVPALRRPRHRDRGPGNVLDGATVLAVRRPRHDRRGSVQDLRRKRLHPPDEALQGEDPRGRPRGQPHPRRRQGRARPRRRPARRPLRGHAGAALAGLQAQGRPPRGRGAAHDRGGDPRRHGRGPDARRHEEDPRAGRHLRRQRPAPARRGAVEALRRRPGRHPLPLQGRDPEVPHRRSSRRRWTSCPR